MTTHVARPRGDSVRSAGPQVAADLAARLLGTVPFTAAIGSVAHEIDWAGPVDLPLAEERAVQAACGIMHVHGRAVGRPTPLAVDYAATAAGVLAAQGVLAALIARARGLRVDGVRTSVGQAALFTLTQYLAAASAADDDEVEYLAPGTAMFTSADGVRFECETLDPQPWLDFWTHLGVDRGTAGRGWRPFQTRYATATCPLPEALHDTLRQLPFAAVQEAAAAAGVGVLPVRHEPQPPVATPPWTCAPFPGWPRRARLPAAAPAGAAPDRPLAGLRVVESTRRVQGPMAGHVLRLLGAQVTRIEPPGGDPMRGIPPMAGGCSARFSALNAGKDVVEIDLASEPGRKAARELVADADVFLHNWAPGRARRWRLDADDVGGTRPDLVYAWCSGWGDGFGAAPPLGTDFLVQAGGGLAAAVRPADEPAAVSLMTLSDVLGGLVCATGVLAALLGRVRTGRGGRVDSSLYSAATLIPRPSRRPHWTPLDRPVPTADGHLWLGRAARARPDRLAKAVGLHPDADLAEIAALFPTSTAQDWLSRLAGAGLTATPVCTDLRRLPGDPAFADALALAEYAVPRSPWEFS